MIVQSIPYPAVSGPPPVGPAEYVGGKNYVWTSGTQSFDFTGLTGGTDTEPQDGDLFILIYSGFETDVPNPTVTLPVGHVAELYNILVALTVDGRQRASWGIYEAGSAAGGSWANTGTIAQIGTILVFRNVDTVEAGSTANAQNSNRANPPSLTPLTEEALIITIGCGSRVDGTLVDYNDPSDGFALIKESANSPANRGGAVMVAAKDDFTSGSFDPAAFTGGPLNDGNCVWIAATLSLKPTIAEFGTNAVAANLRYYFSAEHGAFSDAGITPAANGDGIRQWSNRGTAENAVQSNAARRPIFRTGGLNGMPYVEGVRADQLHFEDLLEGDQPAGFVSFNPHTVFAVVDAVTVGQTGWIFGSGAGQNSGKANFVIFSTGAGFSLYKFSNNFPVPDVGGPNILAAAKRTTGYDRVAFATQSDLWTDTTNFASPNDLGSTLMGFLRNNGGTDTFPGHVYEVLYYAAELNPIAVNGVVTLLKRKYGL